VIGSVNSSLLTAEHAALTPNAEWLAGTLELLTSFMTHAHVCIRHTTNIAEREMKEKAN